MAETKALDGQIVNIIQRHEIAEQSELQEMLKEIGHDIPQATLSRKLKKLNIAKVAGVYKIVDYNMPNLPVILNVQISDFGLIILHTQPGDANSLAYYFDQKYVSYNPKKPKESGILGTIAGDDTILLVVKSKADISRVMFVLQENFPYLVLPKI
jgi:transcriptional regulator of arginine metabolism